MIKVHLISNEDLDFKDAHTWNFTGLNTLVIYAVGTDGLDHKIAEVPVDNVSFVECADKENADA